MAASEAVSGVVRNFEQSLQRDGESCSLDAQSVESADESFDWIQTESPNPEVALYLRRVEVGEISIGDVPMSILASQEFVVNAMENPEIEQKLISLMNSWDKGTMSAFIDSYDTIPEPMMGKLFARGVEASLIPGDVQTNEMFANVAKNVDVKRFVSDIANSIDPKSTKDLMIRLGPNKVAELIENGLLLDRVPLKMAIQLADRIKNPDIKNSMAAELESRFQTDEHGKTQLPSRSATHDDQLQQE
ncbi:MAG: hypothetical protein LBB18_02880 [Puniceicoccales bacterium]|jgi:hypothetical protein|nr:hypothetical protein [Puniceicoccales bacterium]